MYVFEIIQYQFSSVFKKSKNQIWRECRDNQGILWNYWGVSVKEVTLIRSRTRGTPLTVIFAAKEATKEVACRLQIGILPGKGTGSVHNSSGVGLSAQPKQCTQTESCWTWPVGSRKC